MVPVTKEPKLLGEILLILNNLFSLISHPTPTQGFCILKQGLRRGTCVPSPKSPSPLKFTDANIRLQILMSRDIDSFQQPNYSP